MTVESLEMQLMELTLFIKERVAPDVQPELLSRMRRIMEVTYRRAVVAEAEVEITRLMAEMGHVPYKEPEGEDNVETQSRSHRQDARSNRAAE